MSRYDASPTSSHEMKSSSRLFDDDDAEHGGGEQREETKEAREIFVVRHVADAVDKNQKPDERHHHAASSP